MVPRCTSSWLLQAVANCCNRRSETVAPHLPRATLSPSGVDSCQCCQCRLRILDHPSHGRTMVYRSWPKNFSNFFGLLHAGDGKVALERQLLVRMKAERWHLSTARRPVNAVNPGPFAQRHVQNIMLDPDRSAHVPASTGLGNGCMGSSLVFQDMAWLWCKTRPWKRESIHFAFNPVSSCNSLKGELEFRLQDVGREHEPGLRPLSQFFSAPSAKYATFSKLLPSVGSSAWLNFGFRIRFSGGGQRACDLSLGAHTAALHNCGLENSAPADCRLPLNKSVTLSFRRSRLCFRRHMARLSQACCLTC